MLLCCGCALPLNGGMGCGRWASLCCVPARALMQQCCGCRCCRNAGSVPAYWVPCLGYVCLWLSIVFVNRAGTFALCCTSSVWSLVSYACMPFVGSLGMFPLGHAVLHKSCPDPGAHTLPLLASFLTCIKCIRPRRPVLACKPLHQCLRPNPWVRQSRG